jgi:hypothetical protein
MILALASKMLKMGIDGLLFRCVSEVFLYATFNTMMLA